MYELLKSMTENMQLFGFSQRTQETYLYRIRKLIDIRVIQEYLGHKSLRHTMIYTQLTPLIKDNTYVKINNLMKGLV